MVKKAIDDKWSELQVSKFKSLENRVIQKVFIFDMAFMEDEINFNHKFNHPDCPFIQVQALYFILDNNKTIKFITYQNDLSDCMWGIVVENVSSLKELEYGVNKKSIYRMYESKDFPLGIINKIRVEQSSDGVINEVAITINNGNILLITGEVYEENDGSVKIVRDDESILLFLEPDDINRTMFI